MAVLARLASTLPMDLLLKRNVRLARQTRRQTEPAQSVLLVRAINACATCLRTSTPLRPLHLLPVGLPTPFHVGLVKRERGPLDTYANNARTPIWFSTRNLRSAIANQVLSSLRSTAIRKPTPLTYCSQKPLRVTLATASCTDTCTTFLLRLQSPVWMKSPTP